MGSDFFRKIPIDSLLGLEAPSQADLAIARLQRR